jgi:hypothetical protein
VPRLPTLGIAISRPVAALLAAFLIVLGLAASANASSTRKILEACSEGKVPSGYSQQAYNQSLRQMPPELSEYSDCPSLIHKAQLAAAAGGSRGAGGVGGGPGDSGSAAVAPPTPAEQHALENITHHEAAPVKVGGEVVNPGVVHVDIASALSTLPTPVLVLLAFLLACALLIFGRMVGTRIRAGRHEV